MMRTSTRCVHSGESLDPTSGSVTTPIYQTATFGFTTTQDVVKAVSGESGRSVYTRWDNPTLIAAEKKITSLEEGEAAAVFSSGMAAITTTVLSIVSAGDHIVSIRDLYGETYNFFSKILPRLGIEVTLVDTTDMNELKGAVKRNTKLIYLETPTNPTLKVVDIEEVTEFAKKSNNIIVAIDNTFASPINQRPLKFGVDIVLHSATKYLSGHSDLIAGAAVSSRARIHEIKMLRRIFGGTLDPLGGYLLLRGMKTLALRVMKQNENGLKIARYLENHPKVRRVYYPGLETHPQHSIAKRQMKGFGGMLSFELKGDIEAARRFVESVEITILGPSLGGVDTLITQPATTTHWQIDREDRIKAGISDTFIRLSIGIEDAEDLIEEFEQAFNKIP